MSYRPAQTQVPLQHLACGARYRHGIGYISSMWYGNQCVLIYEPHISFTLPHQVIPQYFPLNSLIHALPDFAHYMAVERYANRTRVVIDEWHATYQRSHIAAHLLCGATILKWYDCGRFMSSESSCHISFTKPRTRLFSVDTACKRSS